MTEAQTGRILLVEDNITSRQVALSILERLGLVTDAVTNGEEAVNSLSTTDYDLVLMDLHMPVMDGLETARHIRNPQSAIRNHSIPVIAMTASATPSDQEKCLAAGMNDCILKPPSIRTITEALQKWLPGWPTGKMCSPGTPKVAVADSGTDATIPVFDRVALISRLMADEDLARRICRAFLDSLNLQIESLRRCLEARDKEGSERLAHTIKGAAATMGGEALRFTAWEMEKVGKSGDLDAVLRRLPELEAQAARLQDEIERYVSSG